MKKNQIKVGGIYLVKIGNKVMTVRIEGEHVRGGWNSAILREINTKGEASRFRKTERGKFLLNTNA